MLLKQHHKLIYESTDQEARLLDHPCKAQT